MTFHRMTVKPNVLYRLTVILTARKNAVLEQDYSILFASYVYLTKGGLE